MQARPMDSYVNGSKTFTDNGFRFYNAANVKDLPFVGFSIVVYQRRMSIFIV
jgi:hypothetical protein